jgi:hypothetical protein
MSRISLADGKRAGQKVQRKIAVAVQNVKPLYFLSRSFEIINGKRVWSLGKNPRTKKAALVKDRQSQ